jgi:hypothetical protein
LTLLLRSSNQGWQPTELPRKLPPHQCFNSHCPTIQVILVMSQLSVALFSWTVRVLLHHRKLLSKCKQLCRCWCYVSGALNKGLIERLFASDCLVISNSQLWIYIRIIGWICLQFVLLICLLIVSCLPEEHYKQVHIW